MKKFRNALLVLLVFFVMAFTAFFSFEVITATVPNEIQGIFLYIAFLGAIKGGMVLLWYQFLILLGTFLLYILFYKRKLMRIETFPPSIHLRGEINCRGSTASIPFVSGLYRKGNVFSDKCQEEEQKK